MEPRLHRTHLTQEHLMNTAILKKASLKPLALLAVLPLALTGCVSTANENTDPNGEVSLVKPGTLSVCTNTPYKPFEYEENGTIVASRAWTPAPALPPVSAISPWRVSA